MRLQACPQLAQILRCGTCHQSIDQTEVFAAERQKRLFGAIDYAICPTCGQEVKDREDRGYRQRAGKVLRIKKCLDLKANKG